MISFLYRIGRVHSLPTNNLQASVCSQPNSAEGETEDSNISLGMEGMVNVFLTQPVLVFRVSHMDDCLGRGAG